LVYLVWLAVFSGVVQAGENNTLPQRAEIPAQYQWKKVFCNKSICSGVGLIFILAVMVIFTISPPFTISIPNICFLRYNYYLKQGNSSPFIEIGVSLPITR